MSRRSIIAATVVLVSLLCAAVALAKSEKLNVDVKGDSDAKLSMKMTTKNGAPTKMTGVTVRNLEISCPVGGGEPVIVSHSFAPIPVSVGVLNPSERTIFASEAGERGVTFTINGLTKNGGKKWTGSVTASVQLPPQTCGGEALFAAKRKAK